MPLCTTDTIERQTCGCALDWLGSPCVAHRVWAIPIWPLSRSFIAFVRVATLPSERTRSIFASASRTAMPAESYPRYSSRLNPPVKQELRSCQLLLLLYRTYFRSWRSKPYYFFTGLFQPSLVICFGRVNVKASEGAPRVIVDPAPMVAPSPTVTGAIN